jgi:hypothetical protein
VALYALLLPLTGAITPADLKRALKRDPKAKAAAGADLL